MSFEELATFIEQKMRTSHIYQPVMLTTLLENSGIASEEQIARALLSRDVSQVEYDQIITRDMVSRVPQNTLDMALLGDFPETVSNPSKVSRAGELM